MTEETKEKLRQHNLGKKVSKEIKLKMSKSHMGHKGVIHTEESKKKISEARKGRIVSEETKEKIRNKQNISVIQVETGIIYNSYKEAEEKNGITHIGRYVNNRKPRKGFHYKNNLV